MSIEQTEKELQETRQRLRKEILADLRAVLKKHGAEINAEDHWLGYPECGDDVRMTVEVRDHPKAGYFTLDLGRYLDANNPATVEEGR